MSLRTRLTLLYSSLVGGILLLFGFAVYQLVSFNLIRQIDDILAQTANDLIDATQLSAVGDIHLIPAPDLDLATNLYVQVWEQNAGLSFSSASIRHLQQPLDSQNQFPEEQVYRSTQVGNASLRVLSVPLSIDDRLVGTLQVGASMKIVEATQVTLLTVLIIGTSLAVGVAALAVSLTTYRTLHPLKRVTDMALQITRADDLSRRISYQGSPDDEIGQLIQSFNQTLKRLEKLFISQQRFVADVGHELRTPLTVIKGNATLLRRMGEIDEESLDNIEGEADRLTRMVEDLLLLARVESGKFPLARQMVALDTLLLEVLQQTHVLAKGRVNVRLGDIDQVLVYADRDRLKQVILNLIENAIKYTQPGGEVVAGLGKAGDKARLTISDNGPGIPPEDLPHIFDRFYRVEKSRARSQDGKGFGLGLPIAYWIVRLHGGYIDVDSEVGEGTTFCVWLPLPEEEA